MATQCIRQIDDAEWARLYREAQRGGPVRTAPQAPGAPVPTTGTLPSGVTVIRPVRFEGDEAKENSPPR